MNRGSIKCLSRTRGGDPYGLEMRNKWGMSLSRTRGGDPPAKRSVRWRIIVFPAHAGVIL